MTSQVTGEPGLYLSNSVVSPRRSQRPVGASRFRCRVGTLAELVRAWVQRRSQDHFSCIPRVSHWAPDPLLASEEPGADFRVDSQALPTGYPLPADPSLSATELVGSAPSRASHTQRTDRTRDIWTCNGSVTINTCAPPFQRK